MSEQPIVHRIIRHGQVYAIVAGVMIPGKMREKFARKRIIVEYTFREEAEAALAAMKREGGE